MTRRFTSLTLTLLAVLVLAGCQKGAVQEPIDPDKPATASVATSTMASLSLDADADDALKAAVFLASNPSNPTFPIIDLDKLQYDGLDPAGTPAKLVNVNVVIKSDDPTQPVTYLPNVPFVRSGKMLCLKNRDLTLAANTDFSNAGGRKWYIMAIIGGDLKTTKEQDCVGVNGSTILGWGDPSSTDATRRPDYTAGINVPMAVMPWAEIRLGAPNASGQITSGNANADGGQSPNKFKMMGSILRVVVKNNLQLSRGTLTNFAGLKLQSNVFSTNGYFVFNTPVANGFPSWKDESRGTQAGTYNTSRLNPLSNAVEPFSTIDLSSGLSGKSLAHGESVETFVWVAPRVGDRGGRLLANDTPDTQPAKPATIVSIGTMQMGINPHKYFTTTAKEVRPASFPLSDTLKDGTAYKVGGYEVRSAIPSVGKVHTITIDIVRPVLPLEFVAEANIGATERTFASDHQAANQGYYLGSRLDPYGAVDANATIAPEGYHIPTLGELNGIFTSAATSTTDFTTMVNYSTTTTNPVGDYTPSDGLLAPLYGIYAPVEVAKGEHSLPGYYRNVASASTTYALRYAGKDNNSDYTLLKTAWSYSFHPTLVVNGQTYSNVLVVKSRWVGDPALTSTYTVTDIASSTFFDTAIPASPPNVYGPIVVRYFVAAGKQSVKGTVEEADWVKLNGMGWYPPEHHRKYGEGLHMPRALFGSQKGGSVHDGYKEEYVPIRPFINPETLGY